MVEPDPVLAEPLGRRRGAVLVQADEGAAAEQEHRVVHVGIGVLVDHRLGVEERLVPRDADREVAHRECDVVEGGKCLHGAAFLVLFRGVRRVTR